MVDALERIRKKIEEDVLWKIREFEEDARRKIERMRNEEMGRWEEEKKKILADGKREAESIRSMIISRANLEGKRLLLEAREEVMKKVIEMIKNNARKSPAYGNYIQNAITSAKKIFGDKFRILCNSEDLNLVKNIASRIAPGARVESRDIPYGGVVIESEDTLEVMDFSVGSLIERRMNDIRKKVVEYLFEGE